MLHYTTTNGPHISLHKGNQMGYEAQLEVLPHSRTPTVTGFENINTRAVS
jgi:hypothetical protein